MLEYSNPGDVDLDWVIAVHALTEESEVFFDEVTGLRVPESQRENHEHIFIGLLEAVQVAGYGLDRLLAAAILVGPGWAFSSESDPSGDGRRSTFSCWRRVSILQIRKS